MTDKIQQFFSHTIVTVGAPVTGGLTGILSLFEKILPIVSVFSILFGMVLGYLSYRLKRRLTLKQIKAIDNGKV